MTARVIDGKAVAAELRERVGAGVSDLIGHSGIRPGLAVVLVGDDPASAVYVRNKGAAVRGAGMAAFDHRLPATTPEAELLALVARLNDDPAVHGILVQLPLPSHINTTRVIELINPDKDVDGFHIVNAGRLAVGRPSLVPCTPLGAMMLIKRQIDNTAGCRAVVIGRSTIVGRPMAQLLLAADMTVTIAHSRTRNLPDVCKEADVLVAAIGRPEFVRGDWIKPGAIVIDVGINRLPPSIPGGPDRLVGDVAYREAMAIAGAITPVPGGVGPMTIACLLFNTLNAARQKAGMDQLPPPGPQP